jgi:hypothetical protein
MIKTYGPHHINQTVWHSITSYLQESRLNSTQKQISVPFWFPLQRGHYQPLTWHSFLHTGGQEADFVHSFLSPMSLGLANSDYQMFASLKKYEMPALQDQSQSDKLHNWLHSVLPHCIVYTYLTLVDAHGSLSCMTHCYCSRIPTIWVNDWGGDVHE